MSADHASAPVTPPEQAASLDVSGSAGQPVPLPLSAGPATGYVWLLTLPPGVQRTDNTPPAPVDEAHRLGGGGGGHLQVIAPAGDYILHARLARPTSPDRPIRQLTLHLHIR